ncbi:transposase, Mutator family protein [Burkholderia humptydooensis]|uniref:Mutator family transposase n=1 Tax=Burkholderia humptydooensis MSMB43 TaxID=441157 RepID=A0ABN0FXX7_9BURK|nr:transposase, Mutator family protein [Burkholderia sp. 2002721687]ALX43124.1 transposase [Burkholderia humptydooensis]EIP84783.1 transposase mutator type [Burkholderia humptydooensis MSMB43]
MPRKRKEDVTIEPGKGLNLDPELIKQPVPGTLDRATINEQLAALKKAIFERALGGELTHHLGHEKGEAKPVGRTNHRNGTSRKRIATDDDLFDVEIPRDREGTFDPVLIAKGERRFTGFDDKIIAMYARGMSVREIQGFLLEMSGIEVSPDFISTVTDAVIDEVADEQLAELTMPCGFNDDLAAQVTQTGNRIRGLLTQVHPAPERVLGPRLDHLAVLDLLERYPSSDAHKRRIVQVDRATAPSHIDRIARAWYHARACENRLAQWQWSRQNALASRAPDCLALLVSTAQDSLRTLCACSRGFHVSGLRLDLLDASKVSV